MTQQTTAQTIQRLERELAEVKAKIAEASGVWEPKEGDEYYHVHPDNSVYMGINNFSDNAWNIIQSGNAFRTREEAEKEAKRRATVWKLKKLAGGFVPDWSGKTSDNWVINYTHDVKRFEALWVGKCQSINEIYFRDMHSAQKAIDQLGEELLCLL